MSLMAKLAGEDEEKLWIYHRYGHCDEDCPYCNDPDCPPLPDVIDEDERGHLGIVPMKHNETIGFRDERYHAFVTGKPCIVHGSPGEAHHYGDMTDGRGVGHKATDQKLVPVCQLCHREVEKLGRRGFEQKYGVDFDAVNQRLHILYDERGTF